MTKATETIYRVVRLPQRLRTAIQVASGPACVDRS